MTSHPCPDCRCWTPDDAEPSRRRNPLIGLWSKRNTSSGHFDAIKKSGDVFKGVKREN